MGRHDCHPTVRLLYISTATGTDVGATAEPAEASALRKCGKYADDLPTSDLFQPRELDNLGPIKQVSDRFYQRTGSDNNDFLN